MTVDAPTGPRLFGLTADSADVVAVIRRGPSGWAQVGRWDVAGRRYEPGSWLRGRLYEDSCEVSPDGRYLSYLARKHDAGWSLGKIYSAVSRLPHLTALAAWRRESRWVPKVVGFVADPAAHGEPGPPDVGDLAGLRRRGLGLRTFAELPFGAEQRRGWVLIRDQDRRGRNAVGRPQPHPPALTAAAWLTARNPRRRAYTLTTGPRGKVLDPLAGVQWADWSHRGELLLALGDGRLQIRDAATMRIIWQYDLAADRPHPQPPPAWATSW